MDHLKIVNKYFIETAVFMNAIDATGCPSNQSHWRKKILVWKSSYFYIQSLKVEASWSVQRMDSNWMKVVFQTYQISTSLSI